MHIILDMKTKKIVTPEPLSLNAARAEHKALSGMFPNRNFIIYYLFATGF